ncbi:hypothetical protein MOKP126_31380 [Mycobacterium avium subsp. hominissuis]
MPLEDLEDGPRVLQGLVAAHPGVRQRRAAAAVLVTGGAVGGGGAVGVTAAGGLDFASGPAVVLLFVGPTRRVVLPGLGIEPGEQAAEILGVAEVFVDDGGGVGVRDDVFGEPQVVGEHVVDQRAEQHHIRTGPDRDVSVGDRRGAGESRVDVDHPRAAGPGLFHPLEADRVTLGHVGALDDDAVGIGHVLQ